MDAAQGRVFQSAPSKGIYLSLLLRPDWPVSSVISITPMAAVAVCNEIEAVCGLRPQIKWPNDLMIEDKKVCGILSELELSPDGKVQFVILDIGVNVNQTLCDFPEGLRSAATSLSLTLGRPLSRVSLVAAILQALDEYYFSYLTQLPKILQQYRAECNTLGQDIIIRQWVSRMQLPMP